MTVTGTEKTFRGGYLNVYKPQDWTSTDVVRKLKGVTRVKKIGHGGTLDPVATGVLPICLGSGTRFAEMVLLGTKEYRMEVTLGTATDTYDSQGSVTEEADCGDVSRARAEETLASFVGEFEQVPPMYSAVKHKGRRLYELARQGIEVERVPRRVKVEVATLLRWEPPLGEVHIECSHGFYARSLANDFGKTLGCVAHLSGLERTRAGVFRLEDTHTIEEIEEAADAGRWEELMLPIDYTLQHMRAVKLQPMSQEAVQHGRSLPVAEFGNPVGAITPGDRVRAYGQDGELVAILTFEPERAGWHPEKVLMPL